MSQQENRITDSPFSKWIEDGSPLHDALEVARPPAVRAQAMEEAGAELARQLNGPLTALLLYMGEIKQHSDQISQAGSNRVYLQQVVENALQQTERVCAIIKQMGHGIEGPAIPPGRKTVSDKQLAHGKDATRPPGVIFSSTAGQKPLTRRE